MFPELSSVIGRSFDQKTKVNKNSRALLYNARVLQRSDLTQNRQYFLLILVCLFFFLIIRTSYLLTQIRAFSQRDG